MDILYAIQQVSGNLTWNDIERFCTEHKFLIIKGKNCYKVTIRKSIWTVHLVHGTRKLKHGIVDQLKRVLKKEEII